MTPRTPWRRARSISIGVLVAVLAGACSGDPNPSAETTMPTIPSTVADVRTIDIGDTTLAVELRGAGHPVLLIHGGGEDATMLAGQAESLASAGFQAITYDRRGTGRSGRDHWPGTGADQHADDAAGLLDALRIDQATVLGVSNGGVIALDVAARHPERVTQVIAWEPPAVGVVPGGEAINAEIMAPVNAHLAAYPDDFVGAQAILLSTIVGFPVTADDPAFAAARANAEPMIRDEPTITLERFTADDLAGVSVTVAVGRTPIDLITAATEQITAWTGTPLVRLDADHEVYLSDPTVLTDLVRSLTP